MKPKYVESATCLIGGCDCPAVALDIPDPVQGQAVMWCEAGHVVAVGPDDVIRKQGGFRLVFDFTNTMKPCDDREPIYKIGSKVTTKVLCSGPMTITGIRPCVGHSSWLYTVDALGEGMEPEYRQDELKPWF